jgi:hypothetical protein
MKIIKFSLWYSPIATTTHLQITSRHIHNKLGSARVSFGSSSTTVLHWNNWRQLFCFSSSECTTYSSNYQRYLKVKIFDNLLNPHLFPPSSSLPI